MSFINREKLIKQLHKYGGTGAKPDTWDKGWDDAITRAILIVQQQPVAPIKRRYKARKITKDFGFLDKDGQIPTTLHCEWCQQRIKAHYIYCPYCGAKLEGNK